MRAAARVSVHETFVVKIRLDQAKTSKGRDDRVQGLVYAFTRKVCQKDHAEAQRHQNKHALLSMFYKTGNYNWRTDAEDHKSNYLVTDTMINVLLDTHERQDRDDNRNDNA